MPRLWFWFLSCSQSVWPNPPRSSWQGACVRLELHSRRFYCRSPDCRRKIFTERFPNLTVAYGRRTNRHREALKWIGYALGGEAGFRLASQLGVASSPDTILRVVKQDVCLR